MGERDKLDLARRIRARECTRLPLDVNGRIHILLCVNMECKT